MAGELHLDMRELVGCLIWAEEGRRSGSTASRAAAVDVQRRRGVPVKIGRGGWVGELRGPTVELSRGSAQADGVCSGGPAAASSSPGLRVDGGAGLGSLGRERARERGERVVELPGVLMRAIDEGLGCCAARATAAARWQPREASAGAWRREGRSSAKEEGVEELGRDAWTPARSKGEVGVGRGRPSAVAGGVALSAVRESREGSWGRRQGPKRNFKTFRDLNVIKQ